MSRYANEGVDRGPWSQILELMRSAKEVESEYLARLSEAADLGATDEQIATIAVERCVRRMSALYAGPIGGPPGATSPDIARAVVGALTHCGRLPRHPG